MTANTTNQGFTYPLGTDPPEQLDTIIETAVKQIEKAVVMKFATATERDTKLTGAYAPVTGQICILNDTLKLMKYTGSTWVDVFPKITTSTSDPSGGSNGDIWLKI
jgi:hypothetical protein